MALLVPATAQPGTPGVLGWNRCKKDRVWRKLLVYWFAAERQNGNSGLRSIPQQDRGVLCPASLDVADRTNLRY
jgi:hypothetical protein